MPANDSFDHGVLKHLLEEAGFEDVQLTDISEHAVPMKWLFYIFAIIPYLLLKFLGLEHHFVNAVAGAEMYRRRSLRRYSSYWSQKDLIPFWVSLVIGRTNATVLAGRRCRLNAGKSDER